MFLAKSRETPTAKPYPKYADTAIPALIDMAVKQGPTGTDFKPKLQVVPIF